MSTRKCVLAIASLIGVILVANWSSQVASGQSPTDIRESTLRSLPFGPKQLPPRLFGHLSFTGAYVNAGSAKTLSEILPLARAARMHLVLKLVGDRSAFVNPDGTFSLELWKRHIDRLRSVDLTTYVADSTVIGAELLNEPHNAKKWGGRIISKAELEDAAEYAKTIWPYLPVGAGRSDYVLKYAPWKHLDFGHSQYHMRKGDIEQWCRTAVEESKASGVALLLSLNFYGGEVGDAPMTPEEVQRFGSVLAADTYACGLTGYVYDDVYFARPGISDAFAAVASVAASHRSPRCYVGEVKK
jgi:hypothetical protein